MICTICTPLNTASAGSTPASTGKERKNPKKYGANAPQLHHISCAPAWGAIPDQGSKGKTQKNTVQTRHSCTLSGRKPPEKLIRPPSEHNCDKPAWNVTIWKLSHFG
jgi:hypothetical protein